MLSHGQPCSAAVNFDTYQSLQRHRTVFTEIARLSCLKNRQNHGDKYVNFTDIAGLLHRK